MNGVRGRVSAMLGAAVAVVLTVSACTASPVDPPPSTAAAEPASTSPALSTPPEVEPVPTRSASDGFREWLTASRAPDAATACARLSPELAARMVDELNATGPLQVASCDEMITATAELYRATGQSAEVDIEVEQETATAATLFVTYLSSGDCGTVVLERPATTWILTEQSQECAG
ncbi:hypothetical protein GRS96_05570 [Rathayibacter sp. VKM Ac-2803]|uniref:hypothetical protein n=1 Tax=unclassified Rathayibacter TaxID=2609250 RepID=UPI00135CAC97|nr:MULTISPECIES: hypothetical protein [unclassified Rathayibacter]MWV48748.1 hypothetical protein [Rathayibacter sp. VKM Ac-2803]MWV60356.1 hypothetical protein [Rathayibacter sp. VKM Ac-2754]